MPAVAMSALLKNFSAENIQYYLLMILVLCVSLSFHEAAHGWAAWKLGDDTAYLQGRLTLNPLAHLDLIGSICFVLGGIGWAKPVPINPTRFDRKRTMKTGIVLSSLAGPASNLVLAVAAALLYFIVLTVAALADATSDSLVVSILGDLFYLLYYYNVILAVFNLLPVPPLDGFKIFGAVLPNKIYYSLMRYERYIGLAFLILVVLGGGVLSTILRYVSLPFKAAIWLPLQYLFNLLWQALGLT